MIRVKFTAKGVRPNNTKIWSRQIPECGVFKGIQFLFDPDEKDYDWFVVYDDLALEDGERFSSRQENLRCPKGNSIFVTAEPSTIKRYDRGFLNQFGVVVTSQEPTAMIGVHNVIYTMPCLMWFYGVPNGWELNHDKLLSYEHLVSQGFFDKKELLSTVTSSKAMAKTEHAVRFAFVKKLASVDTRFKLFGRGIKPIEDKSQAINDFKYHLAIENYKGRNHITEKLTDSFLGGALPFYYGADNASEYFPERSFIPIDIHNFDLSYDIIRQAIDNNEYEKRVDALTNAREKVLNQQNIFGMIADIIENKECLSGKANAVIYSRHKYRAKHPFSMIRELGVKLLSG